MDPIDGMALRFSLYLQRILTAYDELILVLKSAPTVKDALIKISVSRRNYMVDAENFPASLFEMRERYARCMNDLDDIRRMAHKVFIINFTLDNPCFVFNKEISFSYACKMRSLVSPLRHHFTGPPLMSEIVRGEIALAMKHPLHLDDVDLFCLETMPAGDITVAKRRSTAVYLNETNGSQPGGSVCRDLECLEEMPDTRLLASPCLLCELN